MKKIFLAALVAVFGCVNQIFAQNQLATLFHDGDIKTFYGIGALKEAHYNAVNGDVITLSSGLFSSTDITKAITIRGAGMQHDSIAKIEPTILSGDFNISINNDSTFKGNSLTMEGIYHNAQGKVRLNTAVHNAQFVKCRFYEIGMSKNTSVIGNSLRNSSFIHCIISQQLYLEESASVSCVNSFIRSPYKNVSSSYESSTSLECRNCVIQTYTYIPTYSIFRDCIIYANSYSIPSTSNAYYCIGAGYSYLFSSVNSLTNKYVTNISEIFKTWDGKNNISSLETENLELTDVAKTKYLGHDGTQVGIYGGSIPFSTRPSNPQITKLNVASKSTPDGKLSVDIEVKAAE